MLKCVAVHGQRYQYNNDTVCETIVPCSQSFTATNDNNKVISLPPPTIIMSQYTIANTIIYATVTPKHLESSTIKGSRHELDQLQAMVPEEIVEMLVHPEA